MIITLKNLRCDFLSIRQGLSYSDCCLVRTRARLNQRGGRDRRARHSIQYSPLYGSTRGEQEVDGKIIRGILTLAFSVESSASQ